MSISVDLAAAIDYLSLAELEELELKLAGPKLWAPFAGKPQETAYHTSADYLYYGGAAGGGKTDLLIGTALTKHTKSVIYRREATQLRQVEDRTLEILDASGIGYRYSRLTHIFRLDNGKTLELGGVPHVSSLSKRQGRPHDFIGFDEAVQFSKHMVMFLCGWLRTDKIGQRCRVVLASNPPDNADGQWVIPYFGPWLDDRHTNPALPGELRYYVVDNTNKEHELLSPLPVKMHGEILRPKSRTFIPSFVQDNPVYMETGYLSQLQVYEEPFRSLYLMGDFKASLSDDPWQVIPTKWIDIAMDRWAETPKPDGFCTAVGVDVARGGQDKTVFAPRYGHWIDTLHAHPGSKTPDGPTVLMLMSPLIRDERTAICVDAIGVGSSVVDIAKSGGNAVTAINAASKSHATDRTGRFPFVNLRAELYWKMRERLDPIHGDPICLPPDKELRQELSSPRFSVRANGISIEPKELIAQRLGRSPDKSDAVTYAFHISERDMSGYFSLNTLESYSTPWAMQ